MAGKLNIDIPGAVAEFESLLNKILPSKIHYKLILRGKGLEFDGYRTFGSDEDASFIDWKASVRGDQLLARQYIEEQDLKIMIVVDVGENMISGSQKKLKCEFAAELASALAHVSISSGDRVGFVFFSNKINSFSLPKTGKTQFDIFASEISNAQNYGRISDLKGVLDKLMEILNKSISLVIFISDFIKVDESYRDKFIEFSSLFETVAIMVRDPLDKTLPEINKEVIIENPETGEKMIINPDIAKKVYEKNAEKQTEIVKKLFLEARIDSVELITNESFLYSLAYFLKRRSERRKYS